ncbi:MAG: rhomboid family intramembrane serine protease [Bacteroidetes bacterium]|nr:rhomboid family intramembrane serine protease [Bacteroidota bacterium]
MAEEKMSFAKSVVLVFGLVAVLWIVFLLQYFGIINTDAYGNWPHHKEGLKGIIFSPFIHGSFEHLISNSLPIIVLLTVLLNAYPSTALYVLVFIHITSGSLVWCLAPDNGVHIGISGIIYGIAGFLVASGLFRKDRTSITIALFVALSYGSMVVGFIPEKGVSWQSHLYGAISGVLIAFVFRKKDLPPPHEFELEKTEDEKHFFDNTEQTI